MSTRLERIVRKAVNQAEAVGPEIGESDPLGDLQSAAANLLKRQLKTADGGEAARLGTAFASVQMAILRLKEAASKVERPDALESLSDDEIEAKRLELLDQLGKLRVVK
jgi:hypothetical protein